MEVPEERWTVRLLSYSRMQTRMRACRERSALLEKEAKVIMQNRSRGR